MSVFLVSSLAEEAWLFQNIRSVVVSERVPFRSGKAGASPELLRSGTSGDPGFSGQDSQVRPLAGCSGSGEQFRELLPRLESSESDLGREQNSRQLDSQHLGWCPYTKIKSLGGTKIH